MRSQTKQMVVALVGNPNSGKSSLFNMITGARQHVGNYPGVTVEKKEGYCTYKGHEITVRRSARHVQPHRLFGRRDHHPPLRPGGEARRRRGRGRRLEHRAEPVPGHAIHRDGRAAGVRLQHERSGETAGLEFDLKQLSGLLEARIVPTVGSKGEGTRCAAGRDPRDRQRGPEGPDPQRAYGGEIEEELARIEAAVLAAGEGTWRTSTARAGSR